jgi:hypothetical protein
MNCPLCDQRLKVTHTYPAGQVRFQRAVCVPCGAVFRLDTKLEPVTKRGEGAKARARQAEQATP